jgi:hypothetical protein
VEIRVAMENEFSDSYFEVLHAFGGILPGADLTNQVSHSLFLSFL